MILSNKISTYPIIPSEGGNKMQYGIVNNPSVAISCHQLEAPELQVYTEPKTESTFQLPIGEFSALSALGHGTLTAGEALLSAVLHYRSNWDSGKTWKSSLRELSRLTGMSVRYIRDLLSDLMGKDWIEQLSKGTNTGSRYQVKHHNCPKSEIPTDKHGNPLKLAIPQGKCGILERLFQGDISWKAALIWLILKRYSNWKTGVTLSISIDTLRKWARMSPQTVSDCLEELTSAKLIKRISKLTEAGKYQLYPKPDGKPKPVYRRKKSKKDKSAKTSPMQVDGDWRLSFNGLWRVNVETCDIQTRKSRTNGLWRGLTLGDTIPEAIQKDFDECVIRYQQVQEKLSKPKTAVKDEIVTESAHRVTESAQGVTQSAQGIFSRLCESIASKGS